MKYLEILTEKQLFLVGYSFILGLIFGASYDIIRIVYILCGLVSYGGEKPVEKKGVLPFAARSLTDLLWTTAAGAAFSVFLYAANDGQFRWFAAASCAGGLAVWHVTAGGIVVRLADRTAAFVRRLIRRFLIVPALFLVRCAAGAAVRIGKLVGRALSRALGGLFRMTVGKAAARIRRVRAIRRTERARRRLAMDIQFDEGEGTRS